MKRIWQNHFKAAKRPAQGTLDIKCKLFSLTQPVRASLWTERSVNCEFLPNLNCFVKEKCRKKEDCRKANFFFFFYLLWISLLFSSQVLSFSILYWFPFLCLRLCATCNRFLFFHMILQQKKNTLEGRIHLTLIDSGMKTPFIFDAVSLILDEWIEDKQCFQMKLFSCLPFPRSWKAEMKVQSAALAVAVKNSQSQILELLSLNLNAWAATILQESSRRILIWASGGVWANLWAGICRQTLKLKRLGFQMSRLNNIVYWCEDENLGKVSTVAISLLLSKKHNASFIWWIEVCQ